MPRNPQAKRSVRRGIAKVNPDGAVVEAGHNTYISHEPLMEGMTWEEQIRQVRDVNPDGVVIDMDTVLASDRPMETFFEQVLEQCPNIRPRQMERQANIMSNIVRRHMEQEFERKQQKFELKMKEKEDRIRELQRQLDEMDAMEQLRQVE